MHEKTMKGIQSMHRRTYMFSEPSIELLETLEIQTGAASKSEVLRRSLEAYARMIQLRDKVHTISSGDETVKAIAFLDSIIEG